MKRTNTAVWLENYNRWQIKVQKDGKRKTFTCSTPGRKGQRECNAKADAWLDDNIENSNLKIKDLYAEYLVSLRETTEQWYRKADSIGRTWFEPNIGHIKISNLTEQHVQDIINKAYAKGLSRKTINNIKSIFLNFLKYCRKRNVTTLFFENIDIPKNARYKGKKILQPDDIVKLFSSSKTYMYRQEMEDEYINAYRFMVLTGMRPGEIMGLQKDDIKNDMVHIKRSKNILNEFTTGKNNNAIRSFALNSLSKQVLEAQPPNDTPFVFGEMCLSTFQKRWARYRDYNKLTPVSLYELRHTFISIVKNLSEGQVKAIVGHSKSMDTFGTYGHQVQGELQQTAADIQNLFSDILKQENPQN